MTTMADVERLTRLARALDAADAPTLVHRIAWHNVLHAVRQLAPCVICGHDYHEQGTECSGDACACYANGS